MTAQRLSIARDYLVTFILKDGTHLEIGTSRNGAQVNAMVNDIADLTREGCWYGVELADGEFAYVPIANIGHISAQPWDLS